MDSTVAAEMLAGLSQPFHPKDLEWRPGSSGTNSRGMWIRTFAYVTSRAVYDRLDQIVGVDNWQSKVYPVSGGFIAELSIRFGDTWVTKTDGADPSDMEAFKGGISGAFKRAGVHFGIGRYLYDLPSGYALVGDPGYFSTKFKKEGYVSWSPPSLPSFALPSEEFELKAMTEYCQAHYTEANPPNVRMYVNGESYTLETYATRMWPVLGINYYATLEIYEAIKDTLAGIAY